MKNSPEKKEKKKRLILNSAIRVFARKGFYNARIKEIARQAKVADGTIYLYFKNKDDILISIFEDRIGKLNEKMLEISSMNISCREKIFKIIELQLGNVRGHRDLAEVITINLRQSNRFLKEFAAPLFNRYLDIMAGIIEDGQKRGEFSQKYPARIIATSLFGAIDGLLLTWVLGPRSHSRLMRAGSYLASVILKGLEQKCDKEEEN